MDKRKKPNKKCEIKFFKITSRIYKSVINLRTASIRYQSATGRKPGVTGEIGEVLVAKKLGLKLAKSDQCAGFDALDYKNRKVQIKTRRGQVGKEPKKFGRVGKFSKHKFDYALLVLLGEKYEILEIWKLNYSRVHRLIRKIKRREPTINQFIHKATEVKSRRDL